MGFFVNVANQILFFSYSSIDRIFQAFGLSWLGFVAGMAVVSVILRLFVGNLVGSAISAGNSRQEAAAQHRIEKKKAKAASGQGASYSTRLLSKASTGQGASYSTRRRK